jgi:hypothetical protein
MSLRAEIHDALDEVTPPAARLEAQVTAFILDGARTKKFATRSHSRVHWTKRFRGVVTLLAAALVVLLMGGLILGGRLLREMYASPQTINQVELKKLEARQLKLPVVSPSAACPISQLTDVSGHGPNVLMRGQGPVYSESLGYNAATTDWGSWSSTALMVDPTKASGPILIRARDLQTNQMVVFALLPFSAAGVAGDGIPTGSVIRNEVILGSTEKVYPEEVLDTSHPYPGTKKGDWPLYKVFLGYPKSATGCIGLQIDGAGFTEVVVVSG